MTIALVCICTVSCLYCLFRPFHRNNVYLTARYMGKVCKIFGLEVEVRVPDSVNKASPVVYICNHQNSYDIFTASNAVMPNTVSLGKKSLKWIPFFGQMYWLTGNILIDRNNTNKAMNTIALTAKKINEKQLSVWMFPEGTRSNGRGLLPFKMGAFRTALQANVPVVPICASSMHGSIKLNRWDNGKMIFELLEPISLEGVNKEDMRSVVNDVHKLMSDKIAELDQEISDNNG
jgi:1-acyl-sn-glycerol-3-phosphate acyltransferase